MKNILVLMILLFMYSVGLVSGATLRLVPTFENCSVYLEGVKGDPQQWRVQYREADSKSWLAGHGLVNSENDAMPRTSLFGLKAGTQYVVRCLDKSDVEVARSHITTWPDKVPILRTIHLDQENPDGKPYMIEAGGTEQGWIRYVGKPGYTIEGQDADEEAVLFDNASFVILENVRIRGGKRHGIKVSNSHHIRIVNCDIAGFGRVGIQDFERGGKYYMPGETRAINYDAGVYIEDSKQLVIERSFIHDPRNTANSWLYSHPAGPTAVFVKAHGEIVIRYNDFVGSDKHRWNDVIEGYGNGKMHGGFQSDSDIYGNYLAFGNDDGIELDGPQRNVRFFGNKVEGMLCGISVAPNLRGPSFIYHNLVVNLGDERGYASAGVKNGGGTTYSKGRSHFYNNTFFTNGHGVKAVGFGKDKNRSRFLGVTRNNVFATSGPGISDPWDDTQNTFDFDLFSTPLFSKGTHAVKANAPRHATLGHPGYRNPSKGQFKLRAGALALTAGTPLPFLKTYAKENSRLVGVSSAVSASGSLPWRHVPARVSQSQINVRSSAETIGEVKAIIQLEGVGNTRSMDFFVEKNSAFNWFDVKASASTLAPNGNVTLTLTLTEHAKSLQGPQQGAFLVTFNDGHRLPVTVVLDMVAVLGYTKVIPVFDQPGADVFKQIADESSIGGTVVDFMPETMRKLGSRSVKITCDIPKAGKYNVYVRVKCPKPFGNHDSLFFSLNGETPSLSPLSPSESWSWNKASKVSALMELKEGVNVFEFKPREPLFMDAVMIRAASLLTGESVNR